MGLKISVPVLILGVLSVIVISGSFFKPWYSISYRESYGESSLDVEERISFSGIQYMANGGTVFNKWECPPATQNTVIVYRITFILNILAIFGGVSLIICSAWIQSLKKKKLIKALIVISVVLSIAAPIFFTLTHAKTFSDTSNIGSYDLKNMQGPWDSFGGSFSHADPDQTISWGPYYGWYLSVLGMIFTLTGAIVTTGSIWSLSRKKSIMPQSIQQINANVPIENRASKPIYINPPINQNANAPSQKIILSPLQTQEHSTLGNMPSQLKPAPISLSAQNYQQISQPPHIYPPIPKEIPIQSIPPTISHPQLETIKGNESPITDNKIEVKRDWEYLGGSVRLKMAVLNRTDSLVADVRIRPLFKEEVFDLDRVEPESLAMKYGEICMGYIGPGEKRSCAIYLDPLICGTSEIEGLLHYRDAQSKLRTVAIPPIKVAVACPLFFTLHEASVASVKNLVENVLEKKDSKVYIIPANMDPSKAFLLAKEVIQLHAVRHVKDFTTQNPWAGEAWYYGITKDNQRPFVMLIKGFAQDKAMIFSAYAESAQNICGLLAEFHAQFNSKLQDERYITSPLKQVTNINIRDSILNRSSLLAEVS